MSAILAAQYTEWLPTILFWMLVALAGLYLHISAQEDEEIGTDNDSDEEFP